MFQKLSKIKFTHNSLMQIAFQQVNYLRPILFLPGDFIFKKDDIGTDMYIVNEGKVQVFADREGKQLLVTLGKRSVFGEISVLLDSSKRRTASIRSVGYSTLFRLKKTDLLDILSNYPEAYLNLKRKANELIRKRNKPVKPASPAGSELFDSIRAESVIKNPEEKKNKLADAVVQLIQLKRK